MGLGLGALLESGRLAVEDYDSIVSINIFIALLCGCIVIGHLLEGNRWVNESITALVMVGSSTHAVQGLITGGVILLVTNGANSRILVFSEDLFFIYLLPPIIFNAGFQVKKKQFFRNFITITLFGAVGTLVSFVIISLAIGAIFSATDSVCTLQVLNQDETPLLYSLVFGEGVVNDATSVVLFNAIENLDIGHFDALVLLNFIGKFLYLFFTSTALGVAAGLLSAYVIKKLCFARHSTDREVAIMILMAYLSYMLSVFTASGHTAVRVNATMITSTVIVVLFSTMVFGLLTKPLLSLLIPARPGVTTSSLLSSQSILDPLLGSLMGSDFDVGQTTPQYNLQYILTAPTRSVHRLWRKFDDRFMRPMFGGRGFVPFVPGSPVERSAPESYLGTVNEADT
ncbi:hypothetical protein PR202_gb24883 [Eleusine coracana subsp. coracana]|uniref:Cation/H+ exchanger transmembrane domain-containing protein n=1 Tax=Eleusine coracana subsp. coracana TaxID=191504 RepID=A0AAV5FN68_ELECO|nr:hypothetical protein PR202_gb24883 [Eleusine coracana subsp. coracana]